MTLGKQMNDMTEKTTGNRARVEEIIGSLEKIAAIFGGYPVQRDRILNVLIRKEWAALAEEKRLVVPEVRAVVKPLLFDPNDGLEHLGEALFQLIDDVLPKIKDIHPVLRQGLLVDPMKWKKELRGALNELERKVKSDLLKLRLNFIGETVEFEGMDEFKDVDAHEFKNVDVDEFKKDQNGIEDFFGKTLAILCEKLEDLQNLDLSDEDAGQAEDKPDERGFVENPKDEKAFVSAVEIIRKHWHVPPLPGVRNKHKALNKILDEHPEIWRWKPHANKLKVHLGRWDNYVEKEKKKIAQGLAAVAKEGHWLCRACHSTFINNPGSAKCPQCKSDDITPVIPRVSR
jgi:rubrerythrin